MARLVFDENFRVFWRATAPDDPEAPTTGEIDAGTEITAFIPKDGFASGVSNNRVDGGDLSTKFNAESMGTWSSQLAVTAFKDDATDTAFDLFGTHGTVGCIIVVPNGTIADGEPCYVWPDIESGAPVLPTTAANERQKFTAEFAVRDEPQFQAAMVTGPS